MKTLTCREIVVCQKPLRLFACAAQINLVEEEICPLAMNSDGQNVNVTNAPWLTFTPVNPAPEIGFIVFFLIAMVSQTSRVIENTIRVEQKNCGAIDDAALGFNNLVFHPYFFAVIHSVS